MIVLSHRSTWQRKMKHKKNNSKIICDHWAVTGLDRTKLRPPVVLTQVPEEIKTTLINGTDLFRFELINYFLRTTSRSTSLKNRFWRFRTAILEDVSLARRQLRCCRKCPLTGFSLAPLRIPPSRITTHFVPGSPAIAFNFLNPVT